MKCAEPHPTVECQKTADGPPKCANCLGAHTANSTECSVYKGKLDYVTRTRRTPTASTNKTYVPAPVPTVSAWNRPPAMVRAQKTELVEKPATLMDLRREVQNINGMASAKPQPQPLPLKFTSAQLVKGDCDDQIGKYNELAEEFRTLNSLIDVDEVLENIRKLNGLLRQCNNKMAKMAVCTKFFQELANQEN